MIVIRIDIRREIEEIHAEQRKLQEVCSLIDGMHH